MGLNGGAIHGLIKHCIEGLGFGADAIVVGLVRIENSAFGIGDDDGWVDGFGIIAHDLKPGGNPIFMNDP